MVGNVPAKTEIRSFRPAWTLSLPQNNKKSPGTVVVAQWLSNCHAYSIPRKEDSIGEITYTPVTILPVAVKKMYFEQR